MQSLICLWLIVRVTHVSTLYTSYSHSCVCVSTLYTLVYTWSSDSCVCILYTVTHVSMTHHQGGGGTADGAHMHATQAQMNAAMLAGWARGVGAGVSINESCRVYEWVVWCLYECVTACIWSKQGMYMIKTIGLFCKRALQTKPTRETYITACIWNKQVMYMNELCADNMFMPCHIYESVM